MSKKVKLPEKQFKEVIQKLKDDVFEFSKKMFWVYRLLDWRWHDEPRTPTQQEIENTLYGLINNITPLGGHYSTGGLCVWLWVERGEVDGVEYKTDYEYGMSFNLSKEHYGDVLDCFLKQGIVENV